MRAAVLLVLGGTLLLLAWLLFPHYDPQRPLVSLGLLVTLCGGFYALLAGVARALRLESLL